MSLKTFVVPRHDGTVDAADRISGCIRSLGRVRERVFAPRCMSDTATSFGESGGANVAEDYDPTSGEKYPREVVRMYATGGLSSTAADLCRVGDSLMAGGCSLLSPASSQELHRWQPIPFTSALPEARHYGQPGWDCSTQSRGRSPGLQALARGATWTSIRKLDPLANLQSVNVSMRDEPWLMRNVPAAVEVLHFNLIRPLRTYDELPRYIDFAGVRRIERPDFAAMAGTALRDQTDRELIGSGWLRTGHSRASCEGQNHGF